MLNYQNISMKTQIQIISNISKLDYQCGGNISGDCSSEFNNAQNNKKLDEFYYRCATEGGSEPLRLRCRLCCENEESNHRFTGTN